jgi:hypothetical protein
MIFPSIDLINSYAQESQKLSCLIMVHPSVLLENLVCSSTYSRYKIVRYGVQLLDLLDCEGIE